MKKIAPPPSLRTAERTLTMKNDEIWRFRFDHACLYEMNRSGQNMNEFLQQMSLEMATGKLDLMYDFVWYLSASFREEQALEINPGLFRARLPLGDLGQVPEMVGNILAEVFPEAAKAATKEAKSGNAEMAPAK